MRNAQREVEISVRKIDFSFSYVGSNQIRFKGYFSGFGFKIKLLTTPKDYKVKIPYKTLLDEYLSY